jgi:hypothetical protein
VQDFDELLVLDTSNAATEVGKKSYHLTDDWNLTRPKDLYTLRYIDGNDSRKLTRLTVRELDERLPYVEGIAQTKPKFYTRRGMNIELIPIPNEVKPIYIYYSQWPAVLVNDDDQSSYETLEDVIITLATEIAYSILEGTHADWDSRAKALLSGSVLENRSRPDRTWVARPFNTQHTITGEPWADPMIKSYP